MRLKRLYPAITILLFVPLLSCDADDTTVVSQNSSEENIQLYYYSKRNDVNNIYKSDLNGNETAIIIDQNHHDWWVRVSPDKQRMLWYKSPLNVTPDNEFNNYEEAELWMANIDGSNPNKVIDLADYNWSAQGVADWSPDGTELVMAAKEGNFWQLYTTDSNGENPQRISQDPNSDYADPSWSPDGEKIVFGKFVGLNLEIHVMNRDGSNEIQLTDDDGFQNFDPYWSPDSNEIAFESKWTVLDCFLLGKWAIRKYSFNTQQTTDVIKNDNINGLARWTTNSEQIYFNILVCGEYARLARMNRDGTNVEIVLENDNFPYYDCDVVQ